MIYVLSSNERCFENLQCQVTLSRDAIAVIGASPSPSSIVLSERVDQSNYRTIRARHHQEISDHNHKHTPANHCNPSSGASIVGSPVVV